jgi:glucosamine-phosphate N-acetyltransferase
MNYRTSHRANHDFYTIRQIERADIEKGEFLKTLSHLESNPIMEKKRAYEILDEINSNPLHRILVAVVKSKHKVMIVGATTILIEPKFIYAGGRVGHIEDVVVRRDYQKKAIGKNLVAHATDLARKMHCVKVILDCSNENMQFYQKLGYTYQDNCMSIRL